jgi:YidC/Oxa1 family membrane protein insertase
VAIILLTIIVRTCIWPIHAKSTYTMKRMALLGPKMKELQDKYKADPQRQQMEVMKLYKEYGVNPLGGCLPMLLQIPIFFGFYSVLENAAELRGQSFLWVPDLSMPDTITQILGYDLNPLPLIMGVTMILQMKLTPQPQTQDKTQKIMFTIMPFFFLFICYNFAAALSLYWSTQNLFSIFQSWVMKLYMKEPTLEKKERPVKLAAAGAGPAGGDPKKPKNRPPKMGG